MCGLNEHHDHDHHHDHGPDHETAGRARVGRALRIGVGGPVGSGKTALIEQLVPRLVARGVETVVVTNDIVTTEDAEHVRRTLAGVLEPNGSSASKLAPARTRPSARTLR